MKEYTDDLILIDFYKEEDVFDNFELTFGSKKDIKDYWGDDWNDAPYEHNAGRVYERYVQMKVHYKPFNCIAVQPCDIHDPNSKWCKEDFKKERTPCLLLVPHSLLEELDLSEKHTTNNDLIREYDDWYKFTYDKFLGREGVTEIYFNETFDSISKKIEELNYMNKLSKDVLMFTTLRNFDDEPPESLAKSVMIEGAELLQNYQFKATSPDLLNVKDEIADVMIYLIRLCNHYGWDYEELVRRKLKKNEEKYPSSPVTSIILEDLDTESETYKQLKQEVKKAELSLIHGELKVLKNE